MTDNGTCFVMQPFDDGGEFDKRYDDVLTPAIVAAGLSPYRVDRDPAAAVPIREIEEGIKAARICLADISTANVNVAFELGYAMASSRPWVIIAKAGTPRWFDVQHNSIIYYATDSSRDFTILAEKVTEALRARVAAVERTEQLPQVLQPTAGLDQHEVALLVAVAGWASRDDETVRVQSVRGDMLRLGYADIAASLAIAELRRRGFIECMEEFDDTINGAESYTACRIKAPGWEWLLANKDRLEMKKKRKPREQDPEANYGDIPF